MAISSLDGEVMRRSLIPNIYRRPIIKQDRYCVKRRSFLSHTVTYCQWWIWDRVEHGWYIKVEARIKGIALARAMSGDHRNRLMAINS